MARLLPGSSYTVEQLPPTSREMLKAFDTRWLLAHQQALPPEDWVDDFGDISGTDAMETVYPLTIMVARFRPFSGMSTFRTMNERSLTIKTKTWEEGYRAPYLEMVKGVYRFERFLEAANNVHIAEMQFRARMIAELLGNGENQPSWDNGNFFRTDHPANPDEGSFGTYSNLETNPTSPNSITNIVAQMTEMQAVKDVSGNILGVRPDTILLPHKWYNTVLLALEIPFISLPPNPMNPGGGSGTMSNPLWGGSGRGLKVVMAPELTNQDDWYLLDSNLVSRMPPWTAQKLQLPHELEYVFYDVNSDRYKDTGFIAVNYRINYGFSLVFPHAIRKIKGVP